MEVNVAKTAGFCFGVKRAVDQVYEQTEKENGKKIYTYGPIIHNEEVVKDLRSRGVEVIHSEEELAALTEGIVIIRSHGVPKGIYDLLEERKLQYVDATCPFVKKIHNIVKKASEDGNEQESAPHPKQVLYVDLGMPLEQYDILRRQEAKEV